MLKKLLLFSALSISSIGFSQTWDKTITNRGSTIEMNDIAIDKYHNIYVTGKYYSDITFGDKTFDNSGGYYDRLYIAKFGEHGNFKWNKNFYSSRDGRGLKIVTSKKSHSMYTLANAGNGYMTVGDDTHFYKVLIKTTLSGEPIWSQSFRATDFDPDLCLDEEDNAYILFTSIESGKFGDLQFDNNMGVYNDFAVGKIDANGKAQWANLFEVNGFGSGFSIDEVNGKLYVAARFDGNMTYKGQQILGDANGTNAFVGILDKETGALLDYLVIGDEGFQIVTEIEVDENGDFVVAGRFSPTIKLGNQTLTEKGKDGDWFAAKYNAKKELQWVHQIASTGLNSQNTSIEDLGTDASGNVYIAGAACETTDIFGTTYKSKGSTDAFLSKIAANGSVSYTLMAGGKDSDEVTAIDVNDDGIVHLFGSFKSVATFGTETFESLSYNSYFISRIIGNGNVLSGKVFYDFDNDGIFNNQDKSYKSAGIVNSKGGISFTDSLGNYNFVLDKGSYEISIPDLPAGFQLVKETATLFSAYGEHKTLDYRIVPTAIQQVDVKVALAPLTRFRPGFPSALLISAANAGNTKADAVLGINLSVNFVFDSASVTPDYQAADSLAWNFNSYAPISDTPIRVYGKIKVGSFLGANAVFMAGIKAIGITDAKPINNADTLVQLVTGAYDPNDKLVSESEVTPSFFENKEYLNYTIRFQNTGNDTAFTVIVSDTISTLLDYKSIKVLASSHSYDVYFGKNNDVHFTFENILLPDSTTNLKGSQGYITFRIYPSGSVKDKDVIANKAYIFFDFNEAIITNTVQTKVQNPGALAIKPKNQAIVNVYPNPVKEAYFFLEKPKGKVNSIRIMNLANQLQTVDFTEQNSNLKVNLPADLAKGLYIGTLRTDSEEKSFKLVVE